MPTEERTSLINSSRINSSSDHQNPECCDPVDRAGCGGILGAAISAAAKASIPVIGSATAVGALFGVACGFFYSRSRNAQARANTQGAQPQTEYQATQPSRQ